MDPIKWMRKNNKKLMAGVVIFLMIAFVGPQFLQQFSQRDTGENQILAYYDEDIEIKARDLALAQQELEILKALSAEIILKSIGVPPLRVPDLHAFFLSELLFANAADAPAVINYIKQTVRENGYRISDRQINEIYAGSGQPHLYWLLLKNEAARAGIKVDSDNAADQLSKIIPQLVQGGTYKVAIGAIVSRLGVSEERILSTFGNLMAVLEGGRVMSSSENLTRAEILSDTVRFQEIMTTDYAKLDSEVFADDLNEPTTEELTAQFEKYKDKFPGSVSEENPYGFGYKLDAMVRLEYMAVKLDDVEAIIARPTQDEIEEYYQRNRQRFVVPALADPDDPNSPETERIQSYGEVAGTIAIQLLRDRVNSKAAEILRDARLATESNIQSLGSEAAKLSAEEYKKAAGDYAAAAAATGEKYKIKVYTGQTGMLDPTDIRRDPRLGMLYIPLRGSENIVGLGQIVFAIDELGISELGPFDLPKPRLYENIGPLNDTMVHTMAVVRVIEAVKPSEPTSLGQSIIKTGIVFDANDQGQGDSFWVREKVSEDLRKLKAMDIAADRAKKLVELAEPNGLDEGLKKFNELYASKGDANGVGAFEFFMQNSVQMRRISSEMLEILAIQTIGNPEAMVQENFDRREKQLADAFYSLIPADGNSITASPVIMEFKPAMSYFVIKSLSVTRLTENSYDVLKGTQIFRDSIVHSQSNAAIFYNPDNIIKRNNFRPAAPVEPVEQTATETSAAAEPNKEK